MVQMVPYDMPCFGGLNFYTCRGPVVVMSRRRTSSLSLFTRGPHF